MDNLEIAKNELRNKNLSLVIVKSKKIIFSTSEYGVKGLMKAIGGQDLHGASVADTVVGKAAAMLCLYANITDVYAVVMSERGLNILKNRMKFEYEKLVPNILNKKKDDICPFEKLVADCDDEKECYEKIKNFLIDKIGGI